MCVDHDAQLPALPVGNQSAAAERIELQAADGNRFDAFIAIPADPRDASVIVLPDVRGLFPFYEDLAQRFAEHGYTAMAIDYFGRTAGNMDRGVEFPFMDHIAQTDSDGINADIRAAVEHLRRGDPATRIFTVGFCFGGTVSWAAATHGHGLAGAIGFYGKPEADRPAGDGPIWDRCDLMRCRLLALFGGADPSIPPGNIERFRNALTSAGVDHDIVTYPGAPHSFFDRSQEDFSQESLDAWQRMIEFMG